MADFMSKEMRSKVMSRIRSKDTKPEMIVRIAVHADGFRYSLHSKKLPGKPDLAFKKYNWLFSSMAAFGMAIRAAQLSSHLQILGTGTKKSQTTKAGTKGLCRSLIKWAGRP